MNMEGALGILEALAPFLLLFIAAALAFACGFVLGDLIDSVMRARNLRRSALSGGSEEKGHSSSAQKATLDDKVVLYMERLSRSLGMRKSVRVAPAWLCKVERRRFEAMGQLAGLQGDVSLEGFCECEARFALYGCALGLLAGAVFSLQLSLALALVGLAVGFAVPGRMLRARIEHRAHEMERHLPEMLDVLALGMRSGMSFDSSLSLYGRHFDTCLSRELLLAQRQWSSGLALRDDALRKVAASYDSPVLARSFETVIRSVRFGTSMVQSIEADAAEARSEYQAKKEEQVAKAPVKMMVPTGVLILPAMLMLVLGPVLLELMEGAV